MFIKGKDLIFYVIIGGQNVPLLRAKTATINTTAKTLATTTFASGKAETNDYSGKYAYTIKGDGVVYIGDAVDGFTLQNAQTTFTKINWTLTDNNHLQWYGVCLVTTTEFTSGFDAVVLFSNELVGDGEYSFVKTNAPPTPPIGIAVTIVDQFGNTIAVIPAPGVYSITKFNAINCGGANQSTPLITITA